MRLWGNAARGSINLGTARIGQSSWDGLGLGSREQDLSLRSTLTATGDLGARGSGRKDLRGSEGGSWSLFASPLASTDCQRATLSTVFFRHGM